MCSSLIIAGLLFTQFIVRVNGGSSLRVPSYTETFIALTSIALTRDEGPWFWAPQVDNPACGVQFMGVFNYQKHPHLKEGADDVTLTAFRSDNGKVVFGNVRCRMQTAFQFADNNFGKDAETASLAIACVVSLDEEIGVWALRNLHEYGKICRTLKTEDLHLQVALTAPSGNSTTTAGKARASPKITARYRSKPAKQRLVDATTGAETPESHEFVVCGVQTYRNPLSPYMLPMFVHHYSSLGYRVALFDRYGLHEDVIREHFPLAAANAGLHYHSPPPHAHNSATPIGAIDYFPFTVLDKATHSNVTKEAMKDQQSYKVYYKEHLKAAQAVDPSAKMEKNTGLLDREKIVTYDHCRLLYAKAAGILYVDTDEFLYCPSIEKTYKQQSIHQRATLHQLADEGIDEIRLDTYPYDTASALQTDRGSADIPTLAACLKRAAPPPSVQQQSQSQSRAPPHFAHANYSLSHQCFSSRSTYPTWMKSADLGRRCPFHYNHWSCDGGKGGGRNLACRCRVSIGPWMSLEQHTASTTRCHLVHLNPQQFQFQAGRNRRQASNKTAYDAALRARVDPSPLAFLLG